MRNWKNEKELAGLLLVRASAGRRSVLMPDTAQFVGARLMTVSEKPTRDEVAMLLCSSKCASPCYACAARANVIVSAYGSSLPD